VGESIETPGVTAAKPKRPKSRGFVMVPKMWFLRLREVKARATTYHVAMVVLDRSRWSEWVVLSNEVVGLDRRTKSAAIKQLRKAGLILVGEEGNGRSPRVKPVFLGNGTCT
jgi:hypothetical protein